MDQRKPWKEKDVLTSVADFLARTSEYQLVGSPTDYARASQRRLAPVSQERPLLTATHRLASESDSLMLASARRRDRQGALIANTTAAIEMPVNLPPSPALPVVEAVSVVPSAPPTVQSNDPGIEASARRNTANHPLDVQRPEPKWSVEDVLARLERETAESADLDTIWPLKLAQLAFHRDNEALELPASLPTVTRDILSAMMRLVPAIRAVARDPMTHGNSALSRVDELRELLADQADPRVLAIALCRKVVTFGVYEELDAEDFVAGREFPAIVYSEIQNLHAEETDDGRFRTELGTRLEVLTAEGQSVWEHEEPNIVDICRTPRKDFFVAERITLPSTLVAGDYVLKVSVEDKLSARFDEMTHPFTILPNLSTADAGG